MANPKRILAQNPTVDVGSIPAIEHIAVSGAKKTTSIIPASNYLGVNTSISVDQGATIAVFNTSTSVGYLAVDTATIGSAPAAPGQNVYPLKAGDWTIVSIGLNAWIRTSANCHAYQVLDNSSLVANN